MSDLLDIAQQAVQAAMRNGAEWADAYCSRVRHADVGMDNSSILDCHVIRDHGLGVRAFYRGGMGFATVQDLGAEAVQRCGEDAARMARVAHPDPDFRDLPQPMPAPEIDGLFDDGVAGLEAETVVQWCLQAIAEARDVAPDARVSGGAGFTVGDGALASSTGVALTRPGTKVDLNVEVTLQRDEDVGFYFDFDVARRMADFNATGLGASAAREALRLLGAQTVPTGVMDLVLGPLTASSLVGAVIGAASAESIQRRRSFLQEMLGESIAADCLTVHERPFWPAGLSSSSHDGEGVARQDMTLIDRGVLQAYLHNSYTANKAGVTSNGHATRGGYTGAVGIGITNLQVVPGDRPEAELIADIEDGLYLSYAELAPDPTSGEVSATVDFGFRILNGQVAYPVKMAMVGSQAFTLLQALDAVSSDYREEPGSILPSLRLRGIQVAGAD